MTLPYITKKQLEILLLIYQFRFIDRKQIQIILNHKNHRRIHSWLNDLVEKHSIGRIYSIKMPENTKPAVYYLAKNGRKHLQKYFHKSVDRIDEAALYQLTKTYKDSQRADVFRTTCLALVDVYIALKQTYGDGEYTMTFSSLTECATYSLLKKFDSYLCLQKKRGKEKRFVYLYLTHRTPRRFIRYRISEIIKFFKQEWDYETDLSYPKVLCVCSNFPIRNYARKVFETKLEYYNLPELSIKLTTLHEIKEQGINKEIWIKPENEEDD